jgi:hypothetical protein
LLEKTDAARRPVRLLGVSVHNFAAEEDREPKDPDRLPFGGTEDTKETEDTEDE